MAGQKQPRPVPTNQFKPNPPPAPPRKVRDVVRVRMVPSCYIYSTMQMVCPGCGVEVPPKTEHRCGKLQDI